MREKIKVCLKEDEYHKTRYYQEFEIVDIDEMKDLADDFNINEITKIDCEQNSKVYDYKYYFYSYVDKESDDDTIYTRYLALPKFDYKGAVYENIEENASLLNLDWKFIDWEEEMQNLHDKEDYFASDEWKKKTDEFSDEDLDNFYTEYGRNGKVYEDETDRDNAIEEIESVIEYWVNDAKKDAMEEEEEYYSFC